MTTPDTTLWASILTAVSIFFGAVFLILRGTPPEKDELPEDKPPIDLRPCPYHPDVLLAIDEVCEQCYVEGKE